MSTHPEVYELYESCTLCPRACGVNRLRGSTGFCAQTQQMKLACACLHKGEEPPLCGERGSGTLFFSGCTLKCLSCQNRQLSRQSLGREITDAELADIMCRLQKQGASNINMVTGSHFLPGIISALDMARRRGLKLPVVWNTSGYEEPGMLRLLEAYVDIFLTDVKTLDRELACTLCNAADYPLRAAEAVIAMTALKSPLWEHGLLKQGVIVRHLVMPEEIASTERVLEWYKRTTDSTALFSLMLQFLPVTGEPPEARDAPEVGTVTGNALETGAAPGTCIPPREPIREVLNPTSHKRRLSRDEYDKVLSLLDAYDIKEGFVQEPAEDDSWLPDFTRLNPFPDHCAQPVWHYRHGYVKDVSGSP